MVSSDKNRDGFVSRTHYGATSEHPPPAHRDAARSTQVTPAFPPRTLRAPGTFSPDAGAWRGLAFVMLGWALLLGVLLAVALLREVLR